MCFIYLFIPFFLRLAYRSDLVVVSNNLLVTLVRLNDCQIKLTLDKFKLDKGDYTKLKELLNLNLDKMLDPSKFSIDEMWEKFKLIMLEGMNKFIPRRGKRNKRSK